MFSKLKSIIRRLKTFIYTFQAKSRVYSYQSPIRVNHKSTLTKQTHLGKNTNFNGMNINGTGKVFIGDNFHSGKDCWLMTQVHNYEGNAIPYDTTYIVKDIVIKDNVWLGNKVIILGGVKIEEGAIIQAGAVVVSDIPKYSIAGGNPAKVFKTRNVDHYVKLKEQGKFH